MAQNLTVTVSLRGGPHDGDYQMPVASLMRSWPADDRSGEYLLAQVPGADVVLYSFCRGGFCERCQLPLMMCSHRLPVPARPGTRPEWERHAEVIERAGSVGPWIESAYPGRCRGCGDSWEPGDRIRFSEDEDGWVCGVCGVGEES